MLFYFLYIRYVKTILLTILTAFILSTTASAQYWQQGVDYRIDVSLNDKEHTLDGFERLTYTNNSTDTLNYVWFHLWPNAYKNDKTAFSDQLLVNGNTTFYFSSREQRGYINRLDFKVNGIAAKTEDHPNYIDVVKLMLPAPLAPLQQITITTPFHVKLPYNFSRGGHDGHSYQITQWYPKPAVYDAHGWHEMPYLDQGEFYSEFASFDVHLTVPKNYVVAATGILQNEEEKNWMLNRSSETSVIKPAPTALKKNTGKQPAAKPSAKKNKAATSNQTATAGTKTLEYKQNNVHDFAWFADPHFIVNHDTCRLSSGRIIDVYSYYSAAGQKAWKNSIQFAKDAVRFYSDEVGEYPYDVISGVQGPRSFGGGMEYPTITVISPTGSEQELDVTLAHEIGHNWFYGMLGSNEREHPWMDEGMNSFYEYKYSKKKYDKTNSELDLYFKTKAIQKTDQAIENPATEFSSSNYALIVYYKTAKWLQSIEKEIGEERFKATMQAYFKQWKFKHPQPQDFKTFFEPILAKNTGNYFSQLSKRGSLPKSETAGWKIAGVFGLKKYIDNPSKNLLLISPAIGANSYDKFMIGGLITNYKLPPSKFQFLLAPLYGTGSKKLNGLGRLSYSFYTGGKIRRTELFLNGSSFSMNEFNDSSNKKFLTRFEKLVPGIKLTFKEKDAKSTVRKYIQWKTFLVREGSFHFGRDTLINGRDSSYKQAISIQKDNRVLNQLQFVYDNNRALYPFNFSINIEQVKDLVRPTITANYFFNYPKDGGLNVRLFAGKIFYTDGRTTSKSFSTDRYHLNITGPDGYEDYNYSNYFAGRNKFEGMASQQIMIRDGGFKFRTDLLGNEVGKTDRWLGALNFTSAIPTNINPLSVLPVKIPLSIFADVGTYADAWDRNSEEDRFLFDAGLQLSLLNDAVNIYLPLLYSKVYSDYYKSYLPNKRFLKTISFSINMTIPALKKLAHEVDF